MNAMNEIAIFDDRNSHVHIIRLLVNIFHLWK